MRLIIIEKIILELKIISLGRINRNDRKVSRDGDYEEGYGKLSGRVDL